MAKKLTKIDPKDKKESGKKARIIANAKYDAFTEEYNRAKEKYAQYYPGGVEFVQAMGYDQLRDAISTVDPNQDIIMMAHYNRDAMYGVPVSDPNFRTFDAPQGKTIASIFEELENKGYQGNCYLGICHGEIVANDIQNAGVDIPIFATPSEKKWVGANPGSKGSFEDFFFGVEGGQGQNFGKAKNPELYEDYVKIDTREQELMNRRKFGDHSAGIKPYNFSQSMNFGGVVEKLGGTAGITNAASGILGGLQMLKQEKQNQKNAHKLNLLSKVVGQAAGLNPTAPTRKYVRPEDNLVNPSDLYPTYGTGTNYLAKNGKRLPGMNFGGFITDLAGEGNEGTAGNMLGSLLGGAKGQQTGAGKIGSTVGGIAGSFLGPVGSAAGSFVGGAIGSLIGSNQQKVAEREQQQALAQLQAAAFQQGTNAMRGQFSSFMEKGGRVPSSMEKGGELEIYDGNASVISYNPYLPGTGETVLFQGPSHKEGGIPMKFGKSTVEVEGGEPATKLANGDLVVFGDMKIPSYGVSELGDPKAKGKKFKNYIKDLSKLEDKQNKVMDQGMELINEPVIDGFDKLRMSSGKMLVEGSNMKLKEIANKKRTAASIQDAILQTAEELNLDSGELAKGKIKKAKKGAKVKANEGKTLFDESALYEGMTSLGGVTNPINPLALTESAITAGQTPIGLTGSVSPSMGDYLEMFNTNNSTPKKATKEQKERGELNILDVINSALPHLRPSNQRPLDPSQLSGEMFALATNQVEPVQAQTYQPLLEQASSVSFQDQLNANQADFNSLLRMTRNNPAAQAALAAQKYAANAAILGEQFRANQDRQLGTQNRNRALLNDATLKNLAILDQQYARQSQARSNTKATTQAALNSIADKLAKNKLENRTLQIYENLYNYRFGNNGQAFNMNPAARFNITDAGSLPVVDSDGKTLTTKEVQTAYDALGRVLGSKKKEKTTTKSKNGSILKALRNL